MLNLKEYPIKRLYDYRVSKKYAVELGPLQEGEKISLMSDSMFKTMFFNENRMKYSCKFLSYFLDVSYEKLLQNIRLIKNELDKRNENDKGERCDYAAAIEDSILNIEINCNTRAYIMERNMEYAFRLYASRIKKGKEEMEYNYTSVIQFNINNFSFKENDKIIDVYTFKNEDDIVLNDKLIIVQIYIPNLRKKWYNEGVESLTEVEKYLLTLVEKDIDTSKELGGGDSIMEEYVDDAIIVSRDEILLESYDKEWANKDEGYREGYESGKDDGFTKGHEEGLEQGIKQGIKQGMEQGMEQGLEQGMKQSRLEIAKSMLQEKITPATISKITGLSLQEIESLE